jgi:Carboxypeptidase regulatory-like domain
MPGRTESKNISTQKRTILIVSSLMTAAALGLLPISNPASQDVFGPRLAEAQNFGQRTIQGKVVNDADNPTGGATVFLKNLKTRTIKSFTSTPDGSFRFAQVGMIDDYEVWAEMGKKKSAVKTVSSFDSRKQVEFDLKLK